jgi:toxin ParE1/3/4
MTAWMTVARTPLYERQLEAVYDHIALDNADAAMAMMLHIDDQVGSLADPNFPRRRGRVVGTLELVAHPNYVVVFQQTDTTVTAVDVLHVARKYP